MCFKFSKFIIKNEYDNEDWQDGSGDNDFIVIPGTQGRRRESASESCLNFISPHIYAYIHSHIHARKKYNLEFLQRSSQPITCSLSLKS